MGDNDMRAALMLGFCMALGAGAAQACDQHGFDYSPMSAYFSYRDMSPEERRNADAAAREAIEAGVIAVLAVLLAIEVLADKVPGVDSVNDVVQTVLQAFAQVPDASVWYGPDTYMGANLAQLFTDLAQLPDEQVQALQQAGAVA
jgi:hypothetical protein